MKPKQIHAIMNIAAKHMDVSINDILSVRRDAQTSVARHNAMYAIRTLSDLSYPAIGRAFHRDHASVIYAVQQVKWKIECIKSYRKDIEALMAEARNV